jgi:K+ transporter
VFLCTTGAEACILTWDIAEENIRISWIFVKPLCLIFGQAAILIHHEGETLTFGGTMENSIYHGRLVSTCWYHNCTLTGYSFSGTLLVAHLH